LAILEKEVWVGLSGNNIKYWKDKGYQISIRKNKNGRITVAKGQKILVRITDLPPKSVIKVTKVCDICGRRSYTQYGGIINSRNKIDGKDRCYKCGYKHASKNREYACNKYYEQRVNETNCLWATNPEIASKLKDTSLGYKLTAGSNKSVLFACSYCGYEYSKIITTAKNCGCGCPKCGDGKSYPAKFMMAMLDQIEEDYEIEKHFDDVEFGNRRCDFYIPLQSMIIETNGKQHKDGSFAKLGGRTAKEEQENDELKRRIAVDKFGIKHYIFIDCYRSEKDYIKNNILRSELSRVYDLSNIDWNECAKFAMSSLMIKACKIFNSGKYECLFEIAEKLHISRDTLRRYLKRGKEAQLCNYDPQKIKINDLITGRKLKNNDVITYDYQ
jgi:hypothetical protein